MKTIRAILGFMIAPLAGVAVILAKFGSGAHGASRISEFISAVFDTAPIIYPITLVLGVPIYVLFRLMNWVSLWQSLLAGVILGPLSFMIFNLVLKFGPLFLWSDVPFICTLGVATTGAFWVIVFWKTERANQRIEAIGDPGSPQPHA